MNPEPNLDLEQAPPALTDMPSAAMASPSSSSSSSSSIGSKSSKASLGGVTKKKEGEPRAGDDLSTPPLVAKAGPPSLPPAVAAAVSSYVLPKARKVRRSAKKKGDDASDKPRRPLSGKRRPRGELRTRVRNLIVRDLLGVFGGDPMRERRCICLTLLVSLASIVVALTGEP